jgi:uncharacterized protein HemX
MVEMTTSHSDNRALPPMEATGPTRVPLRADPTASSSRARSQHLGQQPIVITAVALMLVVVGIGGIFGWRAYSGSTPEPERLTATRLQQARVAQVSEQIVEKTKGIEATQQQSIDQLQVVQDQLQTMQRLMTSQQAETRKLTEQVGALTSTLDNLRQSFASTTAGDDKPAARETPRRARSRAVKRSKSATVQRKRGR